MLVRVQLPPPNEEFILNSKAIGDISVAMVLARFLELGWIVLLPFGDNQRYDIVIDRGNGFEKVQVKTAHKLGDCLEFATCSSYAHRGGKRKSYYGECDLFAVYSKDTNKVYMLKVDDAPKTTCSLRLTPPRNRQKKNIRIASDYEI